MLGEFDFQAHGTIGLTHKIKLVAGSSQQPRAFVWFRPMACEDAHSKLVVRATPGTSESHHQGLFSPVKAHIKHFVLSFEETHNHESASGGKELLQTTVSNIATGLRSERCTLQTTPDRHLQGLSPVKTHKACLSSERFWRREVLTSGLLKTETLDLLEIRMEGSAMRFPQAETHNVEKPAALADRRNDN